MAKAARTTGRATSRRDGRPRTVDLESDDSRAYLDGRLTRDDYLGQPADVAMPRTVVVAEFGVSRTARRWSVLALLRWVILGVYAILSVVLFLAGRTNTGIAASLAAVVVLLDAVRRTRSHTS